MEKQVGVKLKELVGGKLKMQLVLGWRCWRG